MRKIISDNNGTDLTEEFEVESPDLPIFNKTMLDKGFDKIKSFKVSSKGYDVDVDLLNGKIYVDGIEENLELDDETKLKLKDNLCKWINFRRNIISLRMDGLKSRSTKFGIGFQATIDDKNIKRFVLLDRNNKQLIKE